MDVATVEGSGVYQPLASDDLEAQPISNIGNVGKSSLRSFLFVAEVIGMFCLPFYIDIGLDFNSMKTMWDTGNPNLCLANLSGVVIAAGLGLTAFIGKIQEEPDLLRPHRALVLGVLYVIQLHVPFLAWLSIKEGQIHPLLIDAKLIEAIVEAVSSAGVQIYFCIWEKLDSTTRFRLVLSILSSVATMAFGYASFDVDQKGLAGVRGTVPYVSFKFVAILLFRACEVLARICSLALFQRACRPYGAFTECSVELVILSSMIYRYNGSLLYAPASVFTYMNPVLERGNAVSVPFGIYYSFRVASYFILGAIAFAWRGRELFHLYDDDADFIICAAVSITCMIALFPCVRAHAVDSIALYSDKVLTLRHFTPAEKKLRDDLLESVTDESSHESSKAITVLQDALLSSLSNRLSATKGFEFPSDSSVLKREVSSLLNVIVNCCTAAMPEDMYHAACKVLMQLADPQHMGSNYSAPDFCREIERRGCLDVLLSMRKGRCDDFFADFSIFRLAMLLAQAQHSSTHKSWLEEHGVTKLAHDLLHQPLQEELETLKDSFSEAEASTAAIEILVASGVPQTELMLSEAVRCKVAFVAWSVSKGNHEVLDTDYLETLYEEHKYSRFNWKKRSAKPQQYDELVVLNDVQGELDSQSWKEEEDLGPESLYRLRKGWTCCVDYVRVDGNAAVTWYGLNAVFEGLLLSSDFDKVKINGAAFLVSGLCVEALIAKNARLPNDLTSMNWKSQLKSQDQRCLDIKSAVEDPHSFLSGARELYDTMKDIEENVSFEGKRRQIDLMSAMATSGAFLALQRKFVETDIDRELLMLLFAMLFEWCDELSSNPSALMLCSQVSDEFIAVQIESMMREPSSADEHDIVRLSRAQSRAILFRTCMVGSVALKTVAQYCKVIVEKNLSGEDIMKENAGFVLFNIAENPNCRPQMAAASIPELLLPLAQQEPSAYDDDEKRSSWIIAVGVILMVCDLSAAQEGSPGHAVLQLGKIKGMLRLSEFMGCDIHEMPLVLAKASSCKRGCELLLQAEAVQQLRGLCVQLGEGIADSDEGSITTALEYVFEILSNMMAHCYDDTVKELKNDHDDGFKNFLTKHELPMATPRIVAGLSLLRSL